MEKEYIYTLQGETNIKRQNLLRRMGLDPAEEVDFTMLIWDGDELIATGSRSGQILKCIAVDERYQGQGLTASIFTGLRQEAFLNNIGNLFVYTEVKNKTKFESLFFNTISQIDDVVLLEDKKEGINHFISSLMVPCRRGVIGSAVMNCNPFTLGHRYLIEKAASECDWFYVFILSEENGPFPAKDRLLLAKEGTSDLENVTVQSTGPYLISSVTFPTYFIKDKSRKEDIHCRMDIQIFAQYFASAFNIRRRYVGTEPFSPLTDQYNEALIELLPKYNIELRKITRREKDGIPISASAVRALMVQNRVKEIQKLVPETTYKYLVQHQLIK